MTTKMNQAPSQKDIANRQEDDDDIETKDDDNMNTTSNTNLITNTNPITDTSTAGVLLQPPTRMSRSLLWELMREFYQRQGVSAWVQGTVPFFITCNAFIARAYAKTIYAYLADMTAQGSLCVDHPVYIVELGTGAGKFSFLLAKALLERREQLHGPEGQCAVAPVPRVKYIMTDFDNGNFRFWRTHPALQRFIQNGSLDYGVFDAECDTSIHLEHSNVTIRPGDLINPLVVVANYLFDSLPADAYQVRNGQLMEGQVALYTPSAETDMKNPEILNRFTSEFHWTSLNDIQETQNGAEIKPDKRDADNKKSALEALLKDEDRDVAESIRYILRWYQKHFSTPLSPRTKHSHTHSLNPTHSTEPARHQNASFLLPLVSIRCLDRLARLSRGGMLVVSGDKGTSSLNSLVGQHDPHIAVHGSFSLMVNYHALGLWATARGGFAYNSDVEEASLKVGLMVIPSSTSSSPLSQSVEHVQSEAVDRKVKVVRSLGNAFDAADIYDNNVSSTTCNGTVEIKVDSSSTPACNITDSAAGTDAVAESELNHPNDKNVEGMLPFKNRFNGLRATFEDNILSFSPDDFFYIQRIPIAPHEPSSRAGQPQPLPHTLPNNNNPSSTSATSCASMTSPSAPATGTQPADNSSERQSAEGETRLRALCAMLKLSDWDSDLLFKYRDSILELLTNVSLRLRRELSKGLERAWQNYYRLETEKDVAFEIARVFYGLKNFEQSLLFYFKSVQLMGKHHVTEHNIGLCYFHLGEHAEAKAAFGRAIGLNSGYAKAQHWYRRMCATVPIKNNELNTESNGSMDNPNGSIFDNNTREVAHQFPQVMGKHHVSIDPELLARSLAGGVPVCGHAAPTENA